MKRATDRRLAWSRQIKKDCYLLAWGRSFLLSDICLLIFSTNLPTAIPAENTARNIPIQSIKLIFISITLPTYISASRFLCDQGLYSLLEANRLPFFQVTLSDSHCSICLWILQRGKQKYTRPNRLQVHFIVYIWNLSFIIGYEYHIPIRLRTESVDTYNN